VKVIIGLAVVAALIASFVWPVWALFKTMRLRPYDYDKGRPQSKMEWIRETIKEQWAGIFLIILPVEVLILFIFYELIWG
jgi:hypothetical protein